MNTTYWLYLESYTFVFNDTSKFLFYNSLSGEHFNVTKNIVIDGVINKLLEPSNFYCINITEDELKDPIINSLIKKLRDSFTGDYINKKFTNEKPMILFPQLRLMKSVHSEGIDIGNKIMNNLHSLTVQLTDYCDFNCDICESAYKQVITCNKCSGVNLPFQLFEDLVEKISTSTVSNIGIKGGNLFLYPDIDKLHEFMKSNTSFSYNLHINYKQIPGNEDIINILSEGINIILVLQSSENFNADEFYSIVKTLNKSKINYKCEFLIQNEDQYYLTENFCNKYKIKNVSFIPIITIQNLSFFKDILFLDEEVIFSQTYSKKDIFRHQRLNTIDFGSITIMATGDVYANVNMVKLGNLKQYSLLQLIKKEFIEGQSWLRIRNKKPCCDCIYQWLCPSPSNYELAVGKPNLCHVKP
jgi:pseudo-rSAM protein